MEAIVSQLQQFKVDNLTSLIPPESPANSLHGLEAAMGQLSPRDHAPASLPPSFSNEYVSIDFARLRLLDERLEQHIHSVVQQLDELTSPDPSALVDFLGTLEYEKYWLGDCLSQLQGLRAHNDEATRVYAFFMQERVAEFKAGVDLYMQILHDRSLPAHNPNIIQTGN